MGIPFTSTTCPDCGKNLSTGALKKHERICLGNPENYTRILQLLTAHDDVGVSYSRYAELAKCQGVPSVTSLRRLTDTTSWSGMLAAFGLREVPEEKPRVECPVCKRTFTPHGLASHRCNRTAQRQAAVQAEVDSESELIRYEGELLEQDRLRAQCLPVGRITDIGGGWVRCEIR